MSRFTVAAATAHSLSLLAMEEASRSGERTAQVEHLLLALALHEHTAGQVLRALGITYDAARSAIAAQHADQLAAIGIRTEAPHPGEITFHETGGYAWSEPALAILERASTGHRHGDASAVLRELVVEPSGIIDEVLGRMGVSSTDVTDRLDEADRIAHPPPRGATRAEALSGSTEAFAPAAPGDVWALLADPSRMPEWEPSIARVENAPASPRVGDAWTAFARTTRHDGKPIRVRPQFARQRVEIIELDAGRLLALRCSYPAAPAANSRRFVFELEPAAGGTRVRIAFAWERNGGRPRPRPLSRVLRPFARCIMWLQLSQLGAGISRAVR